MQPRQTGCIPPIRLDPVARTSWDQRGSNDDTFMAALRHVALNAIAARPRLVAEPKPRAAVGELAHQPIQGRRGVGDTTVFPSCAADAVLGYRHDDRFLVNIKADIPDTISHDPSPMHEAPPPPPPRRPSC